MAARPPQGAQMLGFGPTSSAELDAREERLEQREENIEELQELEEERRGRDR